MITVTAERLSMTDKYVPKVGDIFKVVSRFEICTCLCTKNGIFASYDRIGRICFDPSAEFQKLSEVKHDN